MSAYICDRKTWKTVLKGFIRYGDLYNVEKDIKDMWNKIAWLNYDSVNYRYHEDSEPSKEELTPPTIDEMVKFMPSDKEIFDAIMNYQYQCCEMPDYHEYDAYYRCDWVKDRMLRNFLGED